MDLRVTGNRGGCTMHPMNGGSHMFMMKVIMHMFASGCSPIVGGCINAQALNHGSIQAKAARASIGFIGYNCPSEVSRIHKQPFELLLNNEIIPGKSN